MLNHLKLHRILAQLVQRRLLWFGHATRRSEGELINDTLLPIPPRTRRKRTEGQLKMWATTIKAGLQLLSEPQIFGFAQWRKGWMKVSGDLAQDRRAWGVAAHDVVNSIGDAGSTLPG